MTQPRILLITPFRNESHSIKYYLKGLKALDYPHELIDVYWLENDSTDNTLQQLEEAKTTLDFNSVTLESILILGGVKKQPPGGYWKDLRYGLPRKNAWMVIWNDIFIPLIDKSDHDYILIYYADVITPPNLIDEYLKVIENYPAGWVGGSMHRRHPNIAIRGPVESPWPVNIVHNTEPTRCQLTGHVWLMPREPLKDVKFYYVVEEMHLSILHHLEKHGLYCYYQPTVYLQHISTDGINHNPENPWRKQDE